LSVLVEPDSVFLVLSSHLGVLRVVRLGNVEQNLQGEESGPNCESWGPLVL
jgi:hypothetical protein